MTLNLRNPTTQKWIILCFLGFGAVYGYVNFIYTPRCETIKRLTSDIKKESELLAKGKRIAANFQTVQEDYARLMQSWDIAQELLPTQKEMEGLLKSITLAGQEHDVTFLLFKPLDPVERPYYWENPIQIKTLSRYHDLATFFTDVASLDRIVNINNVKLTGYKPNRGRSPFTVEAEFAASIYIFKELGAPVTVAAEQETKSARPGRPRAGGPAGAQTPPGPATPQAGAAGRRPGA
jgi:type IV pilus assembly protein PilO